ncbi:hypothetical protein [Nostoc flagelliforme]|uniref:hypothetical protein n=1 Tax=Nostoc flagelliforme TaxID=1306274 RepID=UPI0012FE4F0C|nr:hypothetical protein [Nostoc flagelliforme]
MPTGGTIGSANALTATQLTRGQQNAQDEAVAQLAYALGYGLVGAYDALTDQYSDNSNLLFPRDSIEDASYELGHNIVDLTKDAIDKAKDTIKDLRAHPPHFDIPKPQIPNIELPHLPEFKIPGLPEFKIPEFQIPELQDKDKPNPYPKIEQPKYPEIPSDLERQLRDLDLSHCGSISFGISYVTKRLGEYFDEKTRSFQQIEIPSSLDEVMSLHRAWASKQELDTSGISTLAWLESGGATGSIYNENLGNNLTYRAYQGIGNAIRADGSPGIRGYPNYYASQSIIEITGLRTKTAINSILDSFTFSGRTPEVYRLNVSNSSNKDCPLGKPPPLPDPPPEPPEPDEDCDCMAKCCPDIDYRKIKAFIDEAISKLDLVAAIPISWQIRNEGNRPQLVIQCAEENGVDKDGNKKYKSAMYPISVPHWNGSPGDKITLPSYIKGNYEGIYTLSDNSKVTINAKNEIECKRILNAIKPHISQQYLKDAYFKGGVIVRDKPIKESRVKPRYGRYFKEGQKNNKQDWRIDFK